MDAIVSAFKTYRFRPMDLDSVLEIYTNTPENCPLRKFALAMYECISPTYFQELGTLSGLMKVPQFTAEFVQRLAGNGNYKDRRSLRAEDFYNTRNSDVDAVCGGMEKS